MAERINVKADVLKAFAQDIFRKAGLSVKHSQQTAEALVWADMRGHPAHGVVRIPAYVDWIAGGQINPKAKPKAVLKKGAVVKIAADGAAGPVAMTMAADAAVTQAKEHAVSWVLVQDHGHAGAMGHTAQRVAENGMVAIVMSALRPAMAYHGTKGVAISNSPMAIAMPGGIMLDMSTSATSRTKLDVAKITGKPLQPGLALDKDGRAVSDPSFAETMLPMGGAKGSGLSLMIECMTSAMLGNPLVSSALNDPGQMNDARQNSLIIAMDASVLGNVEQLKTELAMLALSIKGQPRADGFDEILLPGERGARAFARRSREGVPVPARTWNQIGEVAAKLGIGVPQKSAA